MCLIAITKLQDNGREVQFHKRYTQEGRCFRYQFAKRLENMQCSKCSSKTVKRGVKIKTASFNVNPTNPEKAPNEMFS